MKRRLFKLALFLLLGAIVNVAVAWGCAWKLNVLMNPPIIEDVTVVGVVGESSNHIWTALRYKRSGAMRVLSYYWVTVSIR